MKNINSFNTEDIIEINNQKFKYYNLNKAAEYVGIDLNKVIHIIVLKNIENFIGNVRIFI